MHGTRHSPGIQPGDVRALLEGGARVLVLGLGVRTRLGMAPTTPALLRQASLEVQVEVTRAATALYDTLAASGSACGRPLFGGTGCPRDTTERAFCPGRVVW